MAKKLILAVFSIALIGAISAGLFLVWISGSLPKLVTVEDYKPLLVSEVFDRNGEKVGEFFRERRLIVPFEKMPEQIVQAFISAEDSSFFNHGGINLVAIFRAFVANVKAGRKVQGGSTITQQVARSLMLTSEKTYDRKIREILLSYKMEQNLSKQEILYLYLNQIYLGQGAYGVEAAARSYFRKPVDQLNVAEAALLAGLPQAPTRYSPSNNPEMAKQRQVYVLRRMNEEGYITDEEFEKWKNEPLKFFVRTDYKDRAPYFLETLRQYLVNQLGETAVLDEGLRIHTSLDLSAQELAQEEVRKGLRDTDKRQGYRGPLQHIEGDEAITEFLKANEEGLVKSASDSQILLPDGSVNYLGDFVDLKADPTKKSAALIPMAISKLPAHLKVGEFYKGLVSSVNDKNGFVIVDLPGIKGMIDFDTMTWARKLNPEIRYDYDLIKKPSQALKAGDIVLIRIASEGISSERIKKWHKETTDYFKKIKKPLPATVPDLDKLVALELEQEPVVEGALLSFDLQTKDIVAMVGGYSFQDTPFGRKGSQFNRTIQAVRQTGSAFKPFVYLAGLDRGYSPNTVIVDAPIVYKDDTITEVKDSNDSQDNEVKVWKPGNYNSQFGGDILFRNALIESKNIPTIKILDKTGVDTVATYVKRLGVFSPLNMDLSLGLGSSSTTLYEMTRAYGVFANLGRRLTPIMIRKVITASGEEVLSATSLDERFKTDLENLAQEFEKKRTETLAYLNSTDAAKPTDTPPKETGEMGEAETILPAHEAKRKGPLPLYFEDPDQLISPQSAYLITSILTGVIRDPGGTGARARALGRTAAGKTGTTSDYFDTWFIGYTPQFITGVWVGFDAEKSLGRGETGSSTALPIWLEVMKKLHDNREIREFSVPSKIVFANIDAEAGRLASSRSKVVVRQAFLEGTEPGTQQEVEKRLDDQEEKEFLKEDLVQ
ncbi:MAG: penicillin-binding protein 1A [Bdellovibrionales bacterium CG10_big_fil_rev_8_21_14_0_10_45_34]|nr:MAG: penicillin-binding protein 1A [Bdellovibrionales bacterium CG10_big_fil_rev_8_21_14_0_10_45_34]